MHNIYTNVEDRWTKTLSAAFVVLVNCKRGYRYPAQKYKFSNGVVITTKRNPGRFRRGCYNYGKSRHIAWDCSKSRKEEVTNPR